MEVVRQLSLIKGKHRYVFRYKPGCEPEVIDALAALASDPESGFDWFDAAVLSYQMGRRMEAELQHLKPKQ